jgi:hypothetical protein
LWLDIAVSGCSSLDAAAPAVHRQPVLDPAHLVFIGKA